MASNVYLDMTELIRDYFDMPIGTYLNQSISINEVTLSCDIYRVANETVLTSSVFTGCTAVDANTQIIIGKNLSVASGTTLIPPYRCKGIFIGDVGTFTNAGTISMTARGASGAGKNIKLVNNYQISAVGGAGGAASSFNGNSGSAPSSGVLSCGGGGSGSTPGGIIYPGRGGNGTSFSGGAGSGGGNSAQGSDTGGAGSAGVKGDGDSATGGAGNPKGANVSSRVNDNGTYGDGNGTGGLIVIIADTIIHSGSLVSNGVTANNTTTSLSGRYQAMNGGSSGGGCIVLISKTRNITGSNSVSGGLAAQGQQSGTGGYYSGIGGAGGAGVYASYLVEDLILINLPVEIAISDSEHLDNIDPSEAVRILGLTDKDALYYEVMGTRHQVGGGHVLSDGTDTLPQRSILEMDAPLTIEDDDTNEITKVGVDTDVDLSDFEFPAPDLEPSTCVITNPQDGQVLVYDATAQKWKNGGHKYSTSEHVVGTWIDGRPVYEKVISALTFSSDPSNVPDKSYSLVNLGLPNIDNIFIKNQHSLDSNYTGLPWFNADLSGFAIIIVNKDNIILRTNSSSFANINADITIQYTKTTDTATS